MPTDASSTSTNGARRSSAPTQRRCAGSPLARSSGRRLLGPAAAARPAAAQRARPGCEVSFTGEPAARCVHRRVGLPAGHRRPGAGRYLLIFQDLTEIKRLEHEVRIKEKLAAVGEMAAQLAHEIRNPLGSISGSAQVLMGEPGMSAEQAELLAIIRRVEAPLGRPEPVPVPGRAARASARGPVDLGPSSRRRSPCCATAPRCGPSHSVEFDVRRGTARLPGRSRPDHAGLLEPGAQRARGDAGRRAASRCASRRRRTRSC